MVERTRLWRCAFWIYVPILFAATHTPGVKIDTRVRIDLVVHFGAFGTWAGLLALAAYFGPALAWRNIRKVWPIAVVYAAVDEGLQAIPFVHRHAAVDDWAANVGGITIACVSLLLLGVWMRKRAAGSPRSSR